MEQCPKCKLSLRVGKTYYSKANDDTPDIETEVYLNMPMVCVNKSCSLYVGGNTGEPKQIVTTVAHRII